VTDGLARCTVCGKPVFPSAATMFRPALNTTHPRCIRVPKPPRAPRPERSRPAKAGLPGAATASRAPAGDTRRSLDSAIRYLGVLLASAHVLILAEHDVAGQALQRLFRFLGAAALPAASAEQALGLARALRLELVVCEVSRVAGDRRALIDQIRTSGPDGSPVVLGIGVAPMERAGAEAAGFDAYLLKPVGLVPLADALQWASRQRADWTDRQRNRLVQRGQALRAEASRQRADAEATRVDAQAAITRAEKLLTRVPTTVWPRAARILQPRLRPELLGG
jgi:CheY-like chemotaxis protein